MSDSLKKWLNILGGSILGIIGLIFLAYALYASFFAAPHKAILKTLPAESFEILIIMNGLIPEPVLNTLSSALQVDEIPQGVIVVGYKNATGTEYLSIFPEEQAVPQNKKCITDLHYHWCASGDSLSLAYSLIEKSKNNAPSLADLSILQNQSVFSENANLSILGTSAFLPKMIQNTIIPLTPSQREKGISLAQKTSSFFPLFSASIAGNQYQLTWYKKSKQEIFSKKKITAFSTALLPSDTDRYIMLKEPADIWNSIFENGSEKDFPAVAELSGWAKQEISDVFQQKISWNMDIIPLLTQDMLLYSSPKTTSVIFSFDQKNIAQKWYQKFSGILMQFAAEKVPTKKEHQLADGTVIAEIFPEAQAIQSKKESFADGESISFSAPNEVNPKVFPVAAYRQNQLFLSENNTSLSQFLHPGMSVSPFVFPENASIFLSAGIKSRPEEKNPVLFTEIMGVENKNSIAFVAKIDWNTLYFISTPLQGSLETPFPIISPENSATSISPTNME